jgi:polar amino acid transport system ATP-binding protein
MLQLKNATKKFANSAVFFDINLNIEPDTIVGLAGPSGSGKSTLLRCIQGLESLDEGTITFEGKSGFMFQDFQLFNHMNILKNLTYAPNLIFKNKNHKSEALELLNQLGIADKAENFPAELSGGQKQRVALARSLMMKPQLLLCDEPTSGLDIASIEGVAELLLSIKNLGVTMIIASHDLVFLTKIANRIILLRHGSVIADAKTSNLADPISYFKEFYSN